MIRFQDPKIILGIETSCDETACSIGIKEHNRIKLLSNIVASSAYVQKKYGGIVPEQAAREQIKSIIPVVKESLYQAKVSSEKIDAIAVTYGPGLIGSLLVGVETAKTLSLAWNKPLIAINHLLAHFYASWASENKILKPDQYQPRFPFVGLLISGGHTDLILMTGHKKYQYLGGTRDDAAGECFDKCARLLNLPYPGGPSLSNLAKKGDPKLISLPRPMFNSKDFDFSFSGLKTAVANLLSSKPASQLDPQGLANIAASIEDVITEVLIKKTIMAAQKYNIDQIVIAGGVAANSTLQNKLKKCFAKTCPRGQLFIPPNKLCTDNGAVVAICAFYNFYPTDPLKLQAEPNISLTS